MRIRSTINCQRHRFGRPLAYPSMVALVVVSTVLTGCGSDSTSAESASTTEADSASAAATSTTAPKGPESTSIDPETSPPPAPVSTPASAAIPAGWPDELPIPVAIDTTGAAIPGSFQFTETFPVNDELTYSFQSADNVDPHDALAGLAAWTARELQPLPDSANPCNTDAFAGALAAPIEQLTSFVCAGVRIDRKFAVITAVTPDSPQRLIAAVRFK